MAAKRKGGRRPMGKSRARSRPATRRAQPPIQAPPAATAPATAPSSPADRPKKLTQQQIADALGVHRVTVADWYARGCPRGDLEKINAWRSGNLRSERMDHDTRGRLAESLGAEPPPQAAPQQPAAPPAAAVRESKFAGRERRLSLNERRMRAEIKKLEAEAEFKLLRNAREKADLVSRRQVRRELSEMYIRIKDRMLACPDEFETRFPAEVRAAAKRDFEDFVRHLLYEMSNWTIAGGSIEDHILLAASEIASERAQALAADEEARALEAALGAQPESGAGDSNPTAPDGTGAAAAAADPPAAEQAEGPA